MDPKAATCHANKLDYMDRRPGLEQRTLDDFADTAHAHSRASALNERVHMEATHADRIWVYIGTAVGVLFGAVSGWKLREWTD